jgi:hypothetical protein
MNLLNDSIFSKLLIEKLKFNL